MASDPSPIARLLEIMARLRDPETGCPWDIEQDFASIAPYTIEEAYEVADAIEREAWDELRGELGDLLLQVVYHAQMARERGLFDFDAVAETIADKMVARHPHVFGDERDERTAEEQTAAWEAMKARERGPDASVLDNIPKALPAATRALKLQRRAARVGFDWNGPDDVLAKIVEEAEELSREIGGDRDRVEDEYADLLFTVINLGRKLELDPEAALRRVNEKFTRRFQYIERSLAAAGRRLEDASLNDMEALWREAKDDDAA
jgi:ATP diphosphatase